MLMLAALFGKTDIVDFLLQKRADRNLKDAIGKTALDYAKEKSWYSIIEMLEPGAKEGREKREIERIEIEKQKEEVRAKERLTNEFIANEDMIHAIENGKLDLVATLLQEGFPINKKFVDRL
jgi:ankyrin repeat protein